jgi:serralysin
MPHKLTHNPASAVRPEGQGVFQGTFDDYRLFIGGPRADQFFGTGMMDVALGRAGDDLLHGEAEQDELIGMDGADHISGGDGEDHLVGGGGDDTLLGDAAADALRGGEGNDTLDEGPGHGDLEGGPGDDSLTGGLGADAFVIAPDSGNDVIADFVAGPGMFDHLAIRGIQPEQLRFVDTPDGVLISWDTEAGSGSVLLAGVAKSELAQDDFMFAEDRHLIDQASICDEQVTAQHFERNEGGDLSAPAAAGNDPGQFQRVVEDHRVKFGTENGDTFRATNKNDLYFGLGGDDRLSGAGGDDHLAGDAGNDVLDGGAGGDDLRGGLGDDALYGGDQADNLMGDDGADTLYAGAGHDMVDGGAGDDVLHGGDGADAFIVAHGSGNDLVIGGFDAGPGAFDHIAFVDILPSEVTVTDSASLHGDGHSGVLVSWGDGSIFLEGVSKSEMAQDDFMFNAVESGGFVDDPAVTDSGSLAIFIPEIC